jgi:hypothetical protein
LFKAHQSFPRGTVCFLCFAPFGPPFNHDIPPPGTRNTGNLCEYPDVLKELAYIIYKETQVKNVVFTKLGAPVPTTLHSYKRFIGKKCGGGLLGLYKVMATYLDLRESGGLNL